MSESDSEAHAPPGGSDLRITKDCWVVVDYVLYDDEGEVIESTEADDAEGATEGRPLGFVFGYGALVPGFEGGLVGMAVGETRVIEVAPEDGYGARDEELEQWFDRDEFPPDVAPEDELPATDADGNDLTLRVLEVTDDAVLVDANHPLAGATLTFDVVVRAVRAATKEEIARARRSAPKAKLAVVSEPRRPRPSDGLDDEQ